MEIRRSYCGLCHPRCGMLLHMENGKVVKITGDPDHPISRGVLCERGRLMLDHIYHPGRLNHPLKRVGKKGEGKWQRITWDQALDEVAEKLAGLKDEYGAETLAFTHGTKRTYHWDCRRFFNLFGSPNTCGVNTICMCPSYATGMLRTEAWSWVAKYPRPNVSSCGAATRRNPARPALRRWWSWPAKTAQN